MLAVGLAGCASSATMTGGARPAPARPPATAGPSASDPAAGPPAGGGPPQPTPGSPALCPPSGLRLALSVTGAAPTATITVRLSTTSAARCAVTAEAQTPGVTVSAASGAAVWAAGCDHSPRGHDGPEACPAFAVLVPLDSGHPKAWTQQWAGEADATASTPVHRVAAGTYALSARAGGATATARITVR